MRNAEAFERGAAGEESTARALAALPETDWRVFHDVRWPGRRYANIDHVVVGPSGVFVIDTKAWSGEVEVRDGMLRQNGRRRERAVTGAVDAGVAVSELVPGLDPEAVKPVICFDREQPVFGWSHEVMVCSTANVVTLLISRPTILNEVSVQHAAEVLAQSLKAATDPVVPVPSRRQLQVQPARRGRSAKQHQNLARSVISILVLGLLAFFAFTVALPKVASFVRDEARQQLMPTVALGETATVKGNQLRPRLELSVEQLSRTRAPGGGGSIVPESRLWAAQITVRNVGDQAWASNRGTTFAVMDESDAAYLRATDVTKTVAGTMLPAAFRLRPGQTRRGIVLFEVPRGVRPVSVNIRVGPGYPRMVRWEMPGS